MNKILIAINMLFIYLPTIFKQTTRTKRVVANQAWNQGSVQIHSKPLMKSGWNPIFSDKSNVGIVSTSGISRNENNSKLGKIQCAWNNGDGYTRFSRSISRRVSYFSIDGYKYRIIVSYGEIFSGAAL